MKRFLSILLVTCAIFSISYAEEINIKQLSNDDLLLLEIAIQAEKLERGLVKSAHIGAGKYTAGKDIPVGAYILTNEYRYSMNICVYNSSGRVIYNLALWHTGEKTGKIELNEGDILDINGNVLIETFTGVLWE